MERVYAELTYGGSGWQTGNIALSKTPVATNTCLRLNRSGLGYSTDGTTASDGLYVYLNGSNITWRTDVFAPGVGKTVVVPISLIEYTTTQKIQRGQTVCFAGSGTGWQTHDITVTAVPDYTKCRANLLMAYEYAHGEAVISNVGTGFRAYMTSNTNLRIGASLTNSDATGYTVSWEIHPQ